MMDFNGNNRGYAFVTFSTKQEAKAAMKQLNNYEIRSGFVSIVQTSQETRHSGSLGPQQTCALIREPFLLVRRSNISALKTLLYGTFVLFAFTKATATLSKQQVRISC